MSERKGEDAAKEFSFCILAAAAGHPPPYLRESIPRASLMRSFASCMRLALGDGLAGSGNCRQQMSGSELLLAAVVDGALHSPESQVSHEGLNLEAYCRWSKSWPMIQDLLSSLLRSMLPESCSKTDLPFNSQPPSSSIPSPMTLATSWSRVPILMGLGRSRPEDLLLQPLSIWMLSSCLPPGERPVLTSAYECANIDPGLQHHADLRTEWQCLFNSQRDGKSFNTLLGKLGRSPFFSQLIPSFQA